MAPNIPSLPIQQPRTPTSGKSDRINKKVEDLNKRWHLGIQTRGSDWTPSKSHGSRVSPAEKCYENIKCLFWASEAQLDDLLLKNFPQQAQRTSPNNHLKLLLTLLEASLPPKTRPRVRKEESGAKNRIFSKEDHAQLEGLPSTTEFNRISNNEKAEGSGSRVRGTIFVQEQADLLELMAAEDERHQPRSEQPFRPRSLQARHPTPEPEPEQEDYSTPPESPSKADTKRRTPLESPGMPDINGYLGRRKRHSDGDNISPPKRRVSEATTTTTSNYYSANISLNQPVTLNDSLRSTATRIESALTSFSSTPGPSGLAGRAIESANTSFGSEMADMLEVVSKDEVGPPLSSVYGSSMPSLPPDWDSIITNQRLDQTVSFSIQPAKANSVSSVRLSLETSKTVSTETRMMMLDVAEQADEQSALPSEHYHSPRQVFQGLSTATTALEDIAIDSPSPLRRHGSEHWRLSTLPKEHLFVDGSEEPPEAKRMSFKARIECARIALVSGLSVHSLVSEEVVGITKYEDLWAYFKRCAEKKGFKLPRRSSAKAWDDNPRCEYVNLKARLMFNDEPNSRQPLFKLHIDPIEWDKPCRFQYTYGGDRFLYLFLPDLKLPKDLKMHQALLHPRLQEWIQSTKEFLGRKWEVIHVEPVKPKSKQQRKERKVSYRIVLFATEGYDILPTTATYPYTDFTQCAEPSSSPVTTREELVNWFMPLEKNAHQAFCKAFSRLDLGFSKSWRTIHFKPSQVRRVPDTLSDGTEEATEFNDPRCDWTGHQTHRETAMNDGCAQISVGACRLIWKKLGFGTESIPSAFQARINGAKGVWICSGPSDTKSPEHLDVWIEINDSQEKFQPHDEDTDDNFDPNRWTFEVLKATGPLKPNSLNVAFIPILEDRGVKYADLENFIRGIMNTQRHELITSLKDPVNLRAWVNKHMVPDTDRIGGRMDNADSQWQGNLPFARVDRVMHLLESGFIPSELPILGDFAEKVARQYFSMALASFKIHLPRSTMVIGIADPTGILRPGEISMFFSRPIIDEISGECFSNLENIEVLVARHPSLRRSDIQKVRAVYHPELAYLRDVVVFPSKGCVPLASKLQGGDYDGDTFWLCWEPTLTADFKNAPAPLPDQLPKPEDIGITVERRRLSDFLSSPEPVAQFLHESFKFRFQPEILGRCTNLHQRLSYRENSLGIDGLRGAARLRGCAGVTALANLHDLMIDAAKNGYIFGEKNFEDFVRNYTTLAKAFLAESGYEEAMSVGFESDFLSGKIEPPEHLVHILDILYFTFMEPEIKAAIQELIDICKSKDATGLDEALTEPYLSELEDADDDIREELRTLMNAFEPINLHWNASMFPKGKGLVDDDDRSRGGRERWVTALKTCFPMYEALMPKNLDHPIIKRWTKRLGQGPSHWEILKASALYTKFPYKKYPKKAMFIWNMAGRHLMLIKAFQDPNLRPVVARMLEAMKPRKLTKVAQEIGESDGSPGISPSLGGKILNDLTQQEDECASDDDDFSSAADFMDES